jgi:TolA-binding protein
MSKDFAEAERRYTEVLDRYPKSKAAPEALYWKGVSRYKLTSDHTVLGELPEMFRQRYPDSSWALKTAAWEH